MASALENYVNNVRTLSASGHFRDLLERLKGSIELLSKNWSILDNVLETLDFTQHSLGVLYVLLAKFANISNTSIESGNIVSLVNNFILLCDEEHIRFAKPSYFELCHLFANYMVKQPHCIQGIKILVHAIEKIRLFETQLTPIHADLCKICLKAKCYKPALEILDIDITSITSTEDTLNDSKYFLLYYYYGGMIYTAVKNYERALYHFEVAVSTPSMTMSHILLESYKKYLLVSLILHGKVVTIAKYSLQIFARHLQPLCVPYTELIEAYKKASSEDLRNIINKHRDSFVRDKNIDLVSQVEASLIRKNVQRLTRTFLTLSLSDVANRVQFVNAGEAEKHLLKMIRAGEIYASINSKEEMVVFHDDPEKYDSHEMFLKIQDDMERVIELVKEINIREEEIMLNPTYVKKTIGNQDDDMTGASKPGPGDTNE